MRTVLDAIEEQAATLYAAESRVLSRASVCVPMEGGFPVLLADWKGESRVYEALPARASLEDLEDEVLRAAWELGAWDVARDELGPPAAMDQPRAAEESIRVVVGDGPYLVRGGSSGASELDAEGVVIQLVGLATEHGAVCWSWLPNAFNSGRRRANGDRTLSPDGTRPPWEGTLYRPPITPRAERSHTTILDLAAPLQEG